MTTTMRRVLAAACFAALTVALCPRAAQAADLPFGPEGSPAAVQRDAAMRPVTSRPYSALQWPVYPPANRFDIYGNPVGGYLVALPDPLVVDNGCPKVIEPTFDIDGNLAGYAPLVACR